MILPIGVCRNITRRPVVTWTLLGINVAVYLLQYWFCRFLFDIDPDRWYDFFALRYDPRAPWELITHQFMHAGLLHLFSNMIIFYLVSCAIEDRLGHWKTLALYLLGGIAAAMIQAMFTETPLPLVGASGAVFAMVGAFVLLMPWTDIRIFYLFIIFYRFYSGTTKIPAFLFFGCYVFLLELLIAKLTDPSTVAVAHWAHVGGFIFGFGSSAALYGFGAYTRTEREQQKYEREKLRENKSKPSIESHPPPIPAIAKNKTRPPLSVAIVERLIEMGRTQQAFEEFKLLRQAQPGTILSHEALLDLAQKLLANKSYLPAIDIAKIALNNGGSPYETELFVTGANAAIHLPERKRDASRFLKKAIEKLPEGQQRDRLKNQLDKLENEQESEEELTLDSVQPTHATSQSRFNGLEIGDAQSPYNAFAENAVQPPPPLPETVEQSDFAKDRLSKAQRKGEIELLPANTSFDKLVNTYEAKPSQTADEPDPIQPKLHKAIAEAMRGPLRHLGRFQPPVEMPEGLRRSDMPYSYDQFTLLPLGIDLDDSVRFLETIAHVMRKTTDDMLSRMKRSGGAIATNISRYDGESIRDRLADAGIRAVLVPNFDGLHIPSTQLATRFETNGSYVHFDIPEGSCEITTDEIGMVACGSVRLMPGAPVHSLVVDIASFSQDRRFRVVQTDTSPETLRHAKEEIEEMLPQVSPVIVTQSILDWTEHGETPPKFRSPGHYDQYLRWHLMASLAEKYDDLI